MEQHAACVIDDSDQRVGVERRREGSHFWPREVAGDTQRFAVFAVPHVAADAGMRATGNR